MAKVILAYIFVAIWFIHLLVSAGGGYTIIYLNRNKENPLIFRLMIYMNATVLDGLEAIILLFLAKDVVFTWKFSIVIFTFALLKDITRLPMILYLLKGSK